MMKWMFARSDAPGAKLNLAVKAICLVSKPRYHVETLFSDGVSFSAQFGIGARYKDIQYSHPERWDELCLPWITPEMEKGCRLKADIWYALQASGVSQYDTLGAIGCAGSGMENPWDPFCSEVCYDILPQNMILSVLNHKLYPERLWLLGNLLNIIHIERTGQ